MKKDKEEVEREKEGSTEAERNSVSCDDFSFLPFSFLPLPDLKQVFLCRGI